MRIYGLGIDIVSITRIKKTLKNRNDREFSGDIDVEAWQYSWIRTGINNMKNAQGLGFIY